jgi:hypothetical protein
MSNLLTPSMIERLRSEYAKVETINPSSGNYKNLIAKLDKTNQPILQQLADAKIKFVSGLARNRLTKTARVEEDSSPSSVHADILSQMTNEVMALPFLSDETAYKRAVRRILVDKPVIPAAQVEQFVRRYISATPYNKYRAAKRAAGNPIQAPTEVQQESTKLVSTQTGGKKTAKVYKDSETGEFVVKFYVDGKYQKDADYHTDDKQDAMDTAKAETKKANEAVVHEADEVDTDDKDKDPRDIEKREPEDLDLDWISKFDLGEIKEAIQKIIDHLSETEDEEQIDLLRNDIRILDNLHGALGKKDSQEVKKHWKIAKSEGSAEHLHDEFNRRMDDALESKSMREGYVAEEEERNTYKTKSKWDKAARQFRVKATGNSTTAYCKDTGEMMGRWSGEKGWLATC